MQELMAVDSVTVVEHGLGDDVTGDLPEELAWQERALCAQTDPEAFFPEKGGSTREAKRVCMSCDVRPECLSITTMSSGNQVNEWQGTVTNRAFLGDAVDHIVQVGQASLRVRGNPAVSIEQGATVFLTVHPSKVTLVPVG